VRFSNKYYVFDFLCSECDKSFEITEKMMVCPECSYQQRDLEPLRGLLEVNITKRARETPAHLDFSDLLPVERRYFPRIPVGNSPLWTPLNLRKLHGYDRLFIKNDSTNPTFSFKDRASHLVAAYATKLGVKKIVVASTGNAASSMAGIGASAGLNVVIFLPKNAPLAKMVQSLQYGAQVIRVDGSYDAAYELSMAYARQYGGMSRNTAYNPMTIEGKKTVSLEIFRDLKMSAPDYIFVPTGDGSILSGVYKGFADLLKLGFIAKMPIVYCVQANGSNAIAQAMKSSSNEFNTITSCTIADSLAVDVPRAGYLALKYLNQHKGREIVISDEEILAAQLELSSKEGLFVEPAAAAAYAGFVAASRRDQLPHKAKVVILATGSGLKDPDSAQHKVVEPPKPIKNLGDLDAGAIKFR
jgi:threonine synthase